MSFRKSEPVRVYAVCAAALALVAHYVSVPTPLVLALVAAILGLGENTRGKVTPTTTSGTGPYDVIEDAVEGAKDQLP